MSLYIILAFITGIVIGNHITYYVCVRRLRDRKIEDKKKDLDFAYDAFRSQDAYKEINGLKKWLAFLKGRNPHHNKTKTDNVYKPWRCMTPEEYEREYQSFGAHKATFELSIKNAPESAQVAVYKIGYATANNTKRKIK